MPKYTYSCKKCNTGFEKWHGMSEGPGSCPNCGNTAMENFARMPASFNILEPKKNEHKYDSFYRVKPGDKPGEVVKEFIEDAKEELKKEKKRLSKQIIKSIPKINKRKLDKKKRTKK